MKKIAATLLVFAMLGVAAPVVIAAESTAELDASIGFGTGPDGFDTDFGFNVGGGYIVAPNLQLRGDLGYFNFSQDVPGATLEYRRLPIAVSARYYVPLSDAVRFFGQAGLEISFDSFDFITIFGKQTTDETKFGITPGAGIDFFVTKDVSVFTVGRYHTVTNNYWDMQFGAAMHF